MTSRARGFKKSVMLMIWRFQQVYGILAILLWALLLTISAYDKYVQPVFQTYLGIMPNQVALGLTVCFLLVMVFLLLLGVIYDRILRLWVEQSIVNVERNPYLKYKLSARDLIMLETTMLPILKELAKRDQDAQKKLDRVEKWIKKSFDDDPALKKDYDESVRWIEG